LVHFCPTGGTLTIKKVKIFFSSKYDNSYTNRKPVSSRNMLLLNFFEVISSQKNLKNHVKIRLFKRRFEISCFGTKIRKKWKFLIFLKSFIIFYNHIEKKIKLRKFFSQYWEKNYRYFSFFSKLRKKLSQFYFFLNIAKKNIAILI
jgi:hypothetical protein